MENNGNGLGGWILIGLLVWGGFSLFGGEEAVPESKSNIGTYGASISDTGYTGYSGYSGFADNEEDGGYYGEDESHIEDGTHTVEACSWSSGNCYDLEAEIEDGEVTEIHFDNGGYLHLDGAELDEYGQASGDSYSYSDGYNGDSWDIECTDC